MGNPVNNNPGLGLALNPTSPLAIKRHEMSQYTHVSWTPGLSNTTLYYDSNNQSIGTSTGATGRIRDDLMHITIQSQSTGTGDNGVAIQQITSTNSPNPAPLLTVGFPAVLHGILRVNNTSGAWSTEWANVQLFIGLHDSAVTSNVFKDTADYATDGDNLIAMYINTDDADTTFSLLTCDGTTTVKTDTAGVPAIDQSIEFFLEHTKTGSFKLSVYDYLTGALLGSTVEVTADLPADDTDLYCHIGLRTLSASSNTRMRHGLYQLFYAT
jgi:hypothetical protein